MKISRALLAAAALVSLALPATATRIKRMSLDELREQSQSVIVGQVVGSTTRAGEAKSVWTDYQVKVVETLKGGQQPAIRTISFVGGSLGDREMGVDGVPRLQSGRTYVFFLNGEGQQLAAPTTGWGQGLYRVESATVNGVKMQTLISNDGEPLELDTKGRLIRGVAVRVDNGRVVELSKSTGESRRVEMSSAINADGSTSPVAPSRQAAAASTPRSRRFASLEQLRAFMAGRLESGEPHVIKVR